MGKRNISNTFVNRKFCQQERKFYFKFFILFSASSRAVLVQITPVLGVLVGVVVTLILIAICIVIFVKIKNKVRELFNPFLLILTAEKC